MIRILDCNITELRVDAIVNAANETLLGGGGVDGAIHRAAGPGLLAACRALPLLRPGVRCPTGEARLTGGFALPARFIIHTVGPVWEGGEDGEPALLAACYRNVLAIATAQSLDSIAFPAISCGVFGYPPEKAAMIALGEIGKPAHARFKVTLCCRGERILHSYRDAAAKLGIEIQL
ncbi:MAG: O-acetyl-ADP-ribose deacetylase [Dokdonella sp.]|nr:MAG: O-acetyl-ADP-ribose deacetylase [Xanthomonadales bacterium 63-13]